MNDREDIDEILGIVMCDRCGHRLAGEIECPFCSLFPGPSRRNELPRWVYLAACFLTSPLSIYFVIKDNRLNRLEKTAALSGCLFWPGLYVVWF